MLIKRSKAITISQQFEAVARKFPERVALRFEDLSLSYRQLNQRANQLAHYLQELGVKPKSFVGICVSPSLESVIGILAILKAGCAYVPVDPHYPQQRIEFILQDSKAPLLLTQQKLLAGFEQFSLRTVAIDAESIDEKIHKLAVSNLKSSITDTDLAYIIYTSGSTGTPKGVLIEHKNVLRLFKVTAPLFGFTQEDIWPLFHSIAFDVSVWEMWGALFHGGELVIVPYNTTRATEEFYSLLQQRKITVLNQTPGAFKQFIMVDELIAAKGQEQEPLALRYVNFAGEAVNLLSLKPWFDRHGDRQPCLINLYGITETTVHASFRPLRITDLTASTKSPIGHLFSDLTPYLLDEKLQPVPSGTAGELYIAGPGLARGYLNRPELTRERFLPNPFGDDRIYKSGDLVRVLPNGELDYLGRIDHQVKIRGFRIELGEIESSLLKYPNIANAVVIVREDEPGEKYLTAYLVLQQASLTLALKELQHFLEKFLPEYMVPADFVILDQIPLTPHGKLDVKALPKPQRENVAISSEFNAAVTPTEEKLVAIWQDILHLSRIGIDDNFFELGGHSLLITKMLARVFYTFNVSLPFSSVFTAPTIRQLAKLLDTSLQAADKVEHPTITKQPLASSDPLAYVQEGLWYIEQLDEIGVAYHVPFAFRLSGEVNITALTEAIAAFMQRHSVFRTQFVQQPNAPVQKKQNTVVVPLEIIDLSDLPQQQQRHQLHEKISESVSQRFNLNTPPLLRLSLFKLGASQYFLLVDIHHLIYDAWSAPILLRELAEFYQFQLTKTEPQLPILPVEYTDFAVWQRHWLQDNKLQELVQYWQQRLKDCPPLLELPTDFPRTAMPTFQGAEYHFHFSQQLTQDVMKFSQRQQSTLFMTILAIYAVLLNRYTQQNDIVIGAPIANRHYRGVENLIGFFTNTLPLRCQLAEKMTVKAWLKSIREATLADFQHQELPFNKIVQALQAEFQKNYNPLFQVLLVVFDGDVENLELLNVSAKPVHIQNNTSKFDLSLFVRKTKRGIHAWLEYNSQLFSRKTIAGMAKHLRELTTHFVNDANVQLADLNLMTAEERQQLLLEWNATTAPYPAVKGIHQLYEQQVLAAAKKVALNFNDQILSYQQLNYRANYLAEQLIKHGVNNHSIVAICVAPSLEMVIGALAVLKAGAVYLPLDPNYPKVRIQTIIADSGVKILLTEAAFLEKFVNVSTIDAVLFPKKWPAIEKQELKNLDTPQQSEQLAYVIYTSGSTGNPKGIALYHRTLTNLITWQLKVASNYQHVALYSSFSFDVATQVIFYALCGGMTLHVIPEETRKDPFLLMNFLSQHAIDIIFIPPAILQNLAQAVQIEKKALPHLKEIIVAGDALYLTPAIRGFFQQHPHCKLTNQYGPSETHVATAYPLTDDPASWPNLAAIGRPIDNAEIYILDKTFNPVPTGITGEIFIGGPMLAKEYINQVELTAAKFIPHPFKNTAGARIYRTGDLGRYNENGNIIFIGRVDFQIKLRGFRIELNEIEAQLEALPNVQHAAVVLRQDAPTTARLVAYLVAEEHQTIDVTHLNGFLADYLPQYMLPEQYIILASMPLTLTGKIDRKKLPKPEYDYDKHTQTVYVAPKTVLEAELCTYWEELLNREKVGIADSFFELGGHSLLATQLVLHIRTRYSATIPLSHFLKQPTIATLAAQISHPTKVMPLDSEHLHKDTQLSSAIKANPRPLLAAFAPRAVLLTGASGFLGIHLLQELLHNTTANIYCLVRGTDLTSATQHLNTQLEKYYFEQCITNPRIIPVLGDLAQPRLGIEEIVYNQLTATIDTIYHNGAFVHHIYDYDKLRASNVLSTLELIKFCSQGKAKRLHFISTLAAACEKNTHGHLTESFPSAAVQCGDSGYVVSKWASERLLTQANERGFAVSIFRPAYITGQSTTGISPTHDIHLLLFIKGCVQLGVAPSHWGKVDMMPVDFVAKAIVAISLQPDSCGQVYNLKNIHEPAWQQLFTWLQQAGYPLCLIANRVWLEEHLAHIAADNALYPLLPLYLSHHAQGEQEETVTLNANTRRKLKKLHIAYPKIDAELLAVYLKYLQSWLQN